MIVTHTITTDAEAWSSGECVVAVNGLSPRRFLRELRAELPELRACAVTAECGAALIRALRESYEKVEVVEPEKESHD